mmetsp:Transcript_39031/g.72677  ORF Transcript_39031/g.72677 Transcript_39031/m.72677 type:complete len:640 (-) Transcript_39031:216-2135(-)
MADVHIFFGSQSGTAESFSEELQEEAAAHGIKAEVRDLQTFTPEGFAACHIVLLVVATYGDGEPTDNAVAFHRWVSNPKNDGALKGQRFAVMGLGDMNYSRFNNMGQLTDGSLERMGGLRIYKRGVGDDSQDIVEDFQKWKDGGLWEKVKQAVADVKKEGRRVELGSPSPYPTAAAAEKAMGTAVVSLLPAGAAPPAEPDSEPSDVAARFYFEAEKCKVAKVRELRQHRCVEEGLSTVEVEIEATDALQKYTTGGTFALLPRNTPSDVSAMLKLFGLSESDLSRQVSFKAAEGDGYKIKKAFPTPCTLGDALYWYCDLARAPTKKLLTAVQHSLDATAGECVGKLVADADAMKLLQSDAACCRMHEFWALLGVTGGLDLSAFLLSCPRQKAREFTIASSPAVSPKKIGLCVSLTSKETESLESIAASLVAAGALPPSAVETAKSVRGRFLGMCSRWISTELKEGDVVLAKCRASAFALPSKDVPIVMVGAGAGVAPFRGFWDDLRKGPKVAPAVLFFGCRNPDQDWLYKEEMSSAVKLGGGCAALARMQVGPKRPLASLFTAFSRPGEGKEKTYVQDAIRQQGQSVKAWVQNMGGYVFICGSTAMGNGVLGALAEVFDGGEEAVESLKSEGRIIAEMWG